MITCSCLVQEGQSPDAHRDELLGLINDFTTRTFGCETQVAWIPVAEGDGFTAGVPSTSSVVSLVSNELLSPARREELLREFAAMWVETTGSTSDEIVTVIAEPTAG